MTKEGNEHINAHFLSAFNPSCPCAKCGAERVRLFEKHIGSPTPPTPAGAGTETPDRQFSSNPHDHGMVPDTFSPPGFTSWRLRTNEEWVALTEALRRQAEADRATIQAELDHRIAINAALNKTDARGNDEIEQIEWLAAQLASADKDRKRMEFIEGCMTRLITYSEPENNGDWHRLEYWKREAHQKTHVSVCGPTIRAAIDAALQPSASLDHGAREDKK